MTIHVDFELAQILPYGNVMLLLVCLHPALEAIVKGGSFRSHAVVVIVEELDTLHIVLEASISELGDIYLVGQSQLLNVG